MRAVICVEPAAIGELCSIEAVSNLPSLSATSGSTIVMGSGMLKAVVLPRRLPTTVMTGSSAVVSSVSATAGCSAWSSCASAAAGESATAKIATVESAVAPKKRCLVMSLPH